MVQLCKMAKTWVLVEFGPVWMYDEVRTRKRDHCCIPEQAFQPIWKYVHIFFEDKLQRVQQCLSEVLWTYKMLYCMCTTGPLTNSRVKQHLPKKDGLMLHAIWHRWCRQKCNNCSGSSVRIILTVGKIPRLQPT